MRLTSVRRAGRPNLTGFDPKAFAAAAGSPSNDPWARHEAWRYSGPFTRWNRFKGSFPGLGIATVAFAVYCGYEYMFLKDDHHHGHEESHEH
ncbi:NADH-ubiquinone oxidoreductase B12 subunit family-domain-containing protein [Xylogone sp. PMI_703]|nr:NADH-ubiquinone oxidoreductase B12 subunit family-domain-containing protein [Xylogone sp. PMI_703]